jgi:uncharacterized protein (DUF1684 family)
MTDALDLADWRRQVADVYTAVRAAGNPRAGWALWCEGRARLFMDHPESPLPRAARTPEALPHYFPYDPAWRVTADVHAAELEVIALPGSAGEEFGASRFATVSFAVDGRQLALALYWLIGYAGGVFVSFRDATSGSETYGAGRYLLDTAKGADHLGRDGDRLILDFNFAYQPSCSYDPMWSCPLPPRDSWLAMPVRAGERLAP